MIYLVERRKEFIKGCINAEKKLIFCAVLSILIPIYNYNVGPLVHKLHSMATLEQIAFEIICIDDASTHTQPENANISNLANVQYHCLANNIGRSALRNLLAEKAQYPYLLFIDTDMAVMTSDFIHQYIQNLSNYDLIYGGILYEPELTNKSYILRWKYGMQREAINYKERNEDPYFSVKTCNLLIKREAFNTIKFNEKIREYGHEDTLFSLGIERKKLKVLHLQNPLYHMGLEDATCYLRKVEVACKSLCFIAEHYLNEEEKNHIRLLYFYNRLRKMGLLWFVKITYKLFKKRILANLHSANPNLKLLDVYKLISYDAAVNSIKY